jgi:DNA mismatch repair protein MutL
MLRIDGGKASEVVPTAPLAGTQVSAREMFFNVPARQKFLKSDAGETAALKKVFSLAEEFLAG